MAPKLTSDTSWDTFFDRLIRKTSDDVMVVRVHALRHALDVAPQTHRRAAVIASRCTLGAARTREEVERGEDLAAWVELMRPDRLMRGHMPAVVVPHGFQLDTDRAFDEKTDALKAWAAFVSKETHQIQGTVETVHVLEGGGAVSVVYVSNEYGERFVVEVPAANVARATKPGDKITWQVHHVVAEGSERGSQRRLARGGA